MNDEEFYGTDTIDDRVTFGQLVKHCKEWFDKGCDDCEYREFCENNFTKDPKDFEIR